MYELDSTGQQQELAAGVVDTQSSGARARRAMVFGSKLGGSDIAAVIPASLALFNETSDARLVRTDLPSTAFGPRTVISFAAIEEVASSPVID